MPKGKKLKLTKEQKAALQAELKAYRLYKKTDRAKAVEGVLKAAGVTPEAAAAKPKGKTATRKKPATRTKPKK